MKLSLDTGTASHLIRHYDDGGITINETRYTRDLIVMPKAVIDDWASAPVAELTPDHFAVIGDHAREILLLGTGRVQRFPPARLMAELGRQGIGLEVMDTPAACRTYNVLMSEDRRVAAALMIEPVDD
ncbi:MAG: Mth938-like domain-containing protein [Halofilum sp. (in: g-proteobacteria)]|nr:Mth938-like domain-containing protein [Halofilum sp. (in: g-proteobacteria)]